MKLTCNHQDFYLCAIFGKPLPSYILGINLSLSEIYHGIKQPYAFSPFQVVCGNVRLLNEPLVQETGSSGAKE